jgi:hypothetical protein
MQQEMGDFGQCGRCGRQRIVGAIGVLESLFERDVLVERAAVTWRSSGVVFEAVAGVMLDCC